MGDCGYMAESGVKGRDWKDGATWGFRGNEVCDKERGEKLGATVSVANIGREVGEAIMRMR